MIAIVSHCVIRRFADVGTLNDANIQRFNNRKRQVASKRRSNRNLPGRRMHARSKSSDESTDIRQNNQKLQGCDRKKLCYNTPPNN